MYTVSSQHPFLSLPSWRIWSFTLITTTLAALICTLLIWMGRISTTWVMITGVFGIAVLLGSMWVVRWAIVRWSRGAELWVMVLYGGTLLNLGFQLRSRNEALAGIEMLLLPIWGSGILINWMNVRNYLARLRRQSLAQSYVEQGAYAYEHGDYLQAIAAYRQVHEFRPNPSVALYIAHAYRRLGDLEEALKWYDLALSLSSFDALTLWWRGYTYELCREFEKALIDYAEVVRRESTDQNLWLRRNGSMPSRKPAQTC